MPTLSSSTLVSATHDVERYALHACAALTREGGAVPKELKCGAVLHER